MKLSTKVNKIQLHVYENTAKQLHSTKNSTNHAVHVHRPVGSHAQLQLATQPAAVPALSNVNLSLIYQ